jgi:hypothetical protein
MHKAKRGTPALTKIIVEASDKLLSHNIQVSTDETGVPFLNVITEEK